MKKYQLTSAHLLIDIFFTAGTLNFQLNLYKAVCPKCLAFLLEYSRKENLQNLTQRQ